MVGRGQSGSSGFRGVPPKPRFVPQAFLFRCDPVSADEKKVFHHLADQNIHVLEVKQVSHPQSRFKSFRITVAKHEDYNKILSGHFIPEYVRVKRYITPQSERGNGNNMNYFRATGGASAASDGIGQDQAYRKQITELANTLECAQKAVDTRRSESGDAAPMETTAPALDSVQRTVNAIAAVTAASGLTTNTGTREANAAE